MVTTHFLLFAHLANRGKGACCDVCDIHGYFLQYFKLPVFYTSYVLVQMGKEVIVCTIQTPLKVFLFVQ